MPNGTEFGSIQAIYPRFYEFLTSMNEQTIGEVLSFVADAEERARVSQCLSILIYSTVNPEGVAGDLAPFVSTLGGIEAIVESISMPLLLAFLLGAWLARHQLIRLPNGEA